MEACFHSPMHLHGVVLNLAQENIIRIFYYKLRCKDNIKMDLKEGGCENVDWIHQIETSGRVL
jgi:hypothetical protein